MNRSLSLPFTDQTPSHPRIRPSEISHSRLARGARDSRPHSDDSQGAVFPSAPLCRPVSHPGTAKLIAGSPSPHRRGPPRLPTAAVLRLGGEAARCKSARRRSNPPLAAVAPHPAALAARQNPYANRSAATTASRRVRTSVARPGLPPLAAPALPPLRRKRAARGRRACATMSLIDRKEPIMRETPQLKHIEQVSDGWIQEVHSHVRAARRQRLHI